MTPNEKHRAELNAAYDAIDHRNAQLDRADAQNEELRAEIADTKKALDLARENYLMVASTMDRHVAEIAALRAANACLVAGLEKADCTCDAEDSYYHSAGCYRCESLARARELLGGK